MPREFFSPSGMLFEIADHMARYDGHVCWFIEGHSKAN